MFFKFKALCSDCKGTGRVPIGFYIGFHDGIGASQQHEPCQRCATSQRAKWVRRAQTSQVRGAGLRSTQRGAI